MITPTQDITSTAKVRAHNPLNLGAEKYLGQRHTLSWPPQTTAGTHLQHQPPTTPTTDIQAKKGKGLQKKRIKKTRTRHNAAPPPNNLFTLGKGADPNKNALGKGPSLCAPQLKFMKGN